MLLQRLDRILLSYHLKYYNYICYYSPTRALVDCETSLRDRWLTMLFACQRVCVRECAGFSVNEWMFIWMNQWINEWMGDSTMYMHEWMDTNRRDEGKWHFDTSKINWIKTYGMHELNSKFYCARNTWKMMRGMKEREKARKHTHTRTLTRTDRARRKRSARRSGRSNNQIRRTFRYSLTVGLGMNEWLIDIINLSSHK